MINVNATPFGHRWVSTHYASYDRSTKVPEWGRRPQGTGVSSPSQVVERQAPERSVSAARNTDHTAGARCRCYAAFSELLASPHEMDVCEALHQRSGVGVGLDYATGLDALIEECLAADAERLKAEYSDLFEVGSQGPPAPIREDLFTGQKAGTREDIVRFYDYFGYRLGDRFAWAPDHLSVELEFMHYLSFHEATVGEDRLSWQLAQADFAERHLVRWVPQLAAAVAQLAPGSIYSRVLAALREFVALDLDWQRATIVPSGPGATVPTQNSDDK